MNKTFQIHNGIPSLTIVDFWSGEFQSARFFFTPRSGRECTTIILNRFYCVYGIFPDAFTLSAF
jgi:hypothetical protein